MTLLNVKIYSALGTLFTLHSMLKDWLLRAHYWYFSKEWFIKQGSYSNKHLSYGANC